MKHTKKNKEALEKIREQLEQQGTRIVCVIAVDDDNKGIELLIGEGEHELAPRIIFDIAHQLAIGRYSDGNLIHPTTEA